MSQIIINLPAPILKKSDLEIWKLTDGMVHLPQLIQVVLSDILECEWDKLEVEVEEENSK